MIRNDQQGFASACRELIFMSPAPAMLRSLLLLAP
jgi:hypothetical protein